MYHRGLEFAPASTFGVNGDIGTNNSLGILRLIAGVINQIKNKA
jgi:hypothetical protein